MRLNLPESAGQQTYYGKDGAAAVSRKALKTRPQSRIWTLTCLLPKLRASDKESKHRSIR